MISVDLDKIVTAKGLQEHLASILYEVEDEEKVYVVTKQGKPRAALVNVDYLEELTGHPVEPTKEYDRYDQFKAAEETTSTPAVTPPTQPSLEPTTVEVQPEITPPEPVMPVAPVAPTPTTPPPPPPASVEDLERLTTAPTENDVTDPYAVADEETKNPAEQHFDLNGMPISQPPAGTGGPTA